MAAPIIISLSGGGKTASAVAFPKNTSGNSKTLPKPFRALAPLPNTPWSWTGVCRRRSEEHTSELQSRGHLVCRLLLEKKKIIQNHQPIAYTYMECHNIFSLYV